MKELLIEFLDYLKGLNYSKMTVNESSYVNGEFIRYLAEHEIEKPTDIKSADLMAYQKYLTRKRTVKGLPLKPKTINKNLSYVRSFLRYLARKGFILHSTIEALQDLKVAKTLPLGILTHDEIKKMLSCVDASDSMGYRDKAILELLYTSAIRARELIGLDMNKIDFEHGTALVFGKGKKERVVPIGKTALKTLETYVKAVRPFLLKAVETEALFIGYTGNRICYDTLREIVHFYADKAKIKENVTPHTFRRSCTTALVREGANLYHVKELLGHESLDTLKDYAKLTIVDVKKTHAKYHPREKDN